MANLPELNEWPEGVYQLETSDPVLGGPEGIDNLQAKQLASRTRWLKTKADSLGAALADKASKANTLGGYGIGDAFTKPETTAAIQLAIASLVASSPDALDTLKELADALGNDPNFATTITNALAGKANKANTLGGYGIGDAHTKTEVANLLSPLIRSVKRQVFTSSAIYTPSLGMAYCDIELVGGGGGGGGTNGAPSQGAAGGGGGAGGYCRKTFTAAAIGISRSVTIGGGGLGAQPGSNSGLNGGTSTLSGLLAANGGGGGLGGVSTPTIGGNSQGGSGGYSGGGDINGYGQGGQPGVSFGAGGGLGGSGGSSLYGAGGEAAYPTTHGGVRGLGYGAGGSGAASTDTSYGGGDGTPGFCIITEYCTV